jgi:short-subunit dehydrogenase
MALRYSRFMSDIHNTDALRVLVTGASRGIGRATALAFAGSGASVALLARESPELRNVARELDDLGVRNVVAPCDVREVEAVERVLSLNVMGVVNVTRAVLPLMSRRGRGHVINIGSIRGLEGAPSMTAYTASKFAVTGFTRALRQELDGSGILVTLVSPGGVKTGFGGIDPEEKDPTWMEPSAVADLVVQVVGFRGRGWITEVSIMPEPAG